MAAYVKPLGGLVALGPFSAHHRRKQPLHLVEPLDGRDERERQQQADDHEQHEHQSGHERAQGDEGDPQPFGGAPHASPRRSPQNGQ